MMLNIRIRTESELVAMYGSSIIKLNTVSLAKNNILIPYPLLENAVVIVKGTKKELIIYPYLNKVIMNKLTPRRSGHYLIRLHDSIFHDYYGIKTYYLPIMENGHVWTSYLNLSSYHDFSTKYLMTIGFPYNYLVKQLNDKKPLDSKKGVTMINNLLLSPAFKPILNKLRPAFLELSPNVLYSDSIEDLCLSTEKDMYFSNILKRESFLYDVKKLTFKEKEAPTNEITNRWTAVSRESTQTIQSTQSILGTIVSDMNSTTLTYTNDNSITWAYNLPLTPDEATEATEVQQELPVTPVVEATPVDIEVIQDRLVELTGLPPDMIGSEPADVRNALEQFRSEFGSVTIDTNNNIDEELRTAFPDIFTFDNNNQILAS